MYRSGKEQRERPLADFDLSVPTAAAPRDEDL